MKNREKSKVLVELRLDKSKGIEVIVSYSVIVIITVFTYAIYEMKE